MNKDKYVFTQITDFLNRSKFNRIVANTTAIFLI